MLNQKPEKACRYYLSSSRHQLAAACGLSRLLPKFCGTIRLTTNLLVSVFILGLISERVLDGVRHPSLLFAFDNYAVTFFFFLFVFNGRVITADSWLLNAIVHKYCIQSVFVSPLSDPSVVSFGLVSIRI